MLADRDRVFHNCTATATGALPVRAPRRLDGTKRYPQGATDRQRVKESGCAAGAAPAFRPGFKWSFMPKESTRPTYLVVNADESEPGTCKDRDHPAQRPAQAARSCLWPAPDGAGACYIISARVLH